LAALHDGRVLTAEYDARQALPSARAGQAPSALSNDARRRPPVTQEARFLSDEPTVTMAEKTKAAETPAAEAG
jgi:hypothetical protein